MKATVYYVTLTSAQMNRLNERGWSSEIGVAYLEAKDGIIDASNRHLVQPAAEIEADSAEQVWIALQNAHQSWIAAGRAPLDSATLDRFVTVTVDYDQALERRIGEAGGLSDYEMNDLWRLRQRVREANLRRVISTRAFQKAAALKQAGDTWKIVVSTLVEGWSRDEKNKVGIQP